VEVEERFVAASPHGLPGADLLVEHVHPNADGDFLLADAYYEALRRDGRIGDGSNAPSFEDARRDMPITAIDRVLAGYALDALKSGPPFTDERRIFELPAPDGDVETLAQRLHRGEIEWADAMDALMYIHLRAGETAEGARVARLVAQAYPTDASPNLSAGLLYTELGEWARAKRYLERARRAAPDEPRALAALVRVNRQQGDRAAAREHLERLRAVQRGYPLSQHSESHTANHPE
jgi:tetratricopeptide (TPR) repeat protein